MREAHHAAHTVNYIAEGMLLSGEPVLCLPLRHVVLKACKGWGWSKCFSLFSQQDLCIGVQGKLYWYGGMYSLILLYARLWGAVHGAVTSDSTMDSSPQSRGGNGRQTLVQPHMFEPNPVWYSRTKMLTARVEFQVFQVHSFILGLLSAFSYCPLLSETLFYPLCL